MIACDDAIERVLRRTKKEGECLIFTGCRLRNGYGQIRYKGKGLLAHRVVAEHHLGPSSALVLHSCDTRACVNINHLRYGTAAENSRDMVDRGRSVAPTAILTKDDVLAIRSSRESQRTLALHYGVHPTTISKVMSRSNWKKVS